ncbi:flagella biosynthesis regulator Flk [Pantoea sp. 1.19]|uniref:flagella biosynthesis regulator Flk n=1 Tax=Pantoea sp. 1.19 TaxID=1925589 RepID=UPI000948E210|nr:flagella biosynthesis regulator Flk [Pantoea sp. 1.19]
MQPISGRGVPPGGERAVVDHQPGSSRPHAGEQPLSPAQRTTLERLITRILALSNQKGPELWAGIRHEAGVKSDTELVAHHFPAAEQFLQERLTQAQSSHATRQLLQQLTDLLPQGNNRQAVSDFIRQQFGHTVLSALSQDQLRQVLTMLQNGQMAIPQPQHATPSDRTLLPAEHHALNQQIARLAAATGEPPATLWQTALKLVQLKPGDPVPARHFPLLTQYLQVRQTLSQVAAPTLQRLESLLKQPLDAGERQQLEQYSEQRYQIAPGAVLSANQAQDLLSQLFARRAEKLREQPLASSEQAPQPLLHPGDTARPPVLQPLSQRPALMVLAALLLALLLFWLLR